MSEGGAFSLNLFLTRSLRENANVRGKPFAPRRFARRLFSCPAAVFNQTSQTHIREKERRAIRFWPLRVNQKKNVSANKRSGECDVSTEFVRNGEPPSRLFFCEGGARDGRCPLIF